MAWANVDLSYEFCAFSCFGDVTLNIANKIKLKEPLLRDHLFIRKLGFATDFDVRKFPQLKHLCPEHK